MTETTPGAEGNVTVNRADGPEDTPGPLADGSSDAQAAQEDQDGQDGLEVQDGRAEAQEAVQEATQGQDSPEQGQ